MRPKALMCWSSGKDSALALHRVRSEGELEVTGLLTTVTAAYERVSMHGVREELLDRQASSLGLPCTKVRIPYPCPNEIYERHMRQALDAHKAAGVTQVIFGDLFLQDLRAYREARLAEAGLSAVFPVWTADTRALSAEMIALGLRARLTCVDPRKVPAALAGRDYDHRLLEALPPQVDPCGENGEFHTYAYDGPMFSTPIAVHTGEVVSRDGFVFCDLLPLAS